jgi:hypothetical protein
VRADAVMELGGDLAPLFVWRVQQPARQMPQRGFELFALGDLLART